MTLVFKAVAAQGEGLEFVLSDATKDRYGDIVDPAGWVLTNFRRNPIALFGHSNSFPIGTWSNIRVEGGKLLAKLNLAKRGTSQRIDELIGLVEQGILRAVSVGFRPIDSDPIDPSNPYGPKRYKKQELLECSLVSVPANPAALDVARSMNLSTETMTLAFGEHAETRRKDMSATGANAVNPPRTGRSPNMKTLAQRIVDAQTELTAKKDKLAELTASEDLDLDAIEELDAQIKDAERGVAVLKSAEAKIGINAQPTSTVAAPAINRRPLGFPQRDVEPLDLLVRALTVQGIRAFGGGDRTIDKILDERYPGHEATAIIAKADQTIGTTTTPGWASELIQTVNQGFLQALTGRSIYPALRDRGVGLNFDSAGTIKLPRRNAGGAGGGFVAEGSPIRVGRVTTAAAELSPRKMGVIVPFSRELARRSTPAIEAIVRQGILDDTAAVLDAALLDAVAGNTARPAGLRNGVAAVGTATAGGDHEAVKADFRALLAPFIAANAADDITVIMNPAQGLSIAMMDGPANNANWFDGIRGRVNIVESTYATAGRLVAVRTADFYTAIGDAPEFDINETASVHMEDTTPLELVSGTPVVADPVRSFYQTATVGVRMLMDVSWVMGRPGMVQWIDGVSY